MPACAAMIRKQGTAQVYLQSATQYAFATTPATAQANIRFVASGGPGGAVQSGPGTTPTFGTFEFTWLISGAAADYEVRVTTASGTGFAGDALATWLGLGSTRTWRLTRASPDGTTTGTANVEIRRVSDSVVIAGPVTFTLTAERGP